MRLPTRYTKLQVVVIHIRNAMWYSVMRLPTRYTKLQVVVIHIRNAMW